MSTANWIIIGFIVLLWLQFFFWDSSDSLPAAARGIKPLTNSQNSHNGDSIAQYHIFGSAQQLYDIPLSQGQTSLDFVLNGTMSNLNEKTGFAYISNAQGIQRKFNVGDKIFNLATLKEIYKTHVVLQHNGKNERLSLPESTSVVTPNKTTKPTNNKTAKPSYLKHLTGAKQRNWQQLLDQQKFDPNKIASIAGNIHMVTNQAGKIQGLRVSNLAQSNILKQHGLKSNDIITAINGNKISDTNILTIQQTLQQNPNATVTIKRNGKIQNVQINLDNL